jgi:hypothetical protein
LELTGAHKKEKKRVEEVVPNEWQKYTRGKKNGKKSSWG